MKDLLAGVVRQLVDIKAALSLMPSLRWATVTQSSPLRIALDGDSAPLADAPFCLIPKPKTGDRVSVIVANRRATIIGMPGGGQLSFPPGFIAEYAGESAPLGWLLCDGRQVRISEYPELYAVLGRRYGGSGDLFALPNHRGRVGVGLDPVNPAFNQLGKTGGAATHTLTAQEMPRHRHPHDGYTFLWGSSGNVHIAGAVANSGTSSGNRLFTWQNRDGWKNTGEAGGGQAHNNLQPYVVTNFIIKT